MIVWIVLAAAVLVLGGLSALASRRRAGNSDVTSMQDVDRRQYKADFGDPGRGR
jgi:hypothetical protein